MVRFKIRNIPSVAVIVMVSGLCLFDINEMTQFPTALASSSS